MIIQEIPFALLIAGSALLGLYLANVFFDYSVPQYISRKIGHLGGCAAFMLCPLLFSSFVWPLILTIGFTLLLGYARILRPKTFRGVGGSGRPEALAELHFPATGIITIAIGWALIGKPWLAIVPLLFMGGGDALTGLIRSKVYGREVKGAWGSLGMILSCLLFASFIAPYWIGIFGAIAATIAEKYTKTRRFIDDNLTIPMLSFVVMLLLYSMGGML